MGLKDDAIAMIKAKEVMAPRTNEISKAGVSAKIKPASGATEENKEKY